MSKPHTAFWQIHTHLKVEKMCQMKENICKTKKNFRIKTIGSNMIIFDSHKLFAIENYARLVFNFYFFEIYFVGNFAVQKSKSLSLIPLVIYFLHKIFPFYYICYYYSFWSCYFLLSCTFYLVILFTWSYFPLN